MKVTWFLIYLNNIYHTAKPILPIHPIRNHIPESSSTFSYIEIFLKNKKRIELEQREKEKLENEQKIKQAFEKNKKEKDQKEIEKRAKLEEQKRKEIESSKFSTPINNRKRIQTSPQQNQSPKKQNAAKNGNFNK